MVAETLISADEGQINNDEETDYSCWVLLQAIVNIKLR